MSEWMLDELMDAWQAIQRGKVTGDVQIIMVALDAANMKIASMMFELDNGNQDNGVG